jgi:hypothetical protein
MAPDTAHPTAPQRPAAAIDRPVIRWRWLTGGGTTGNAQLTAAAGVVLIGLLAALGVTIVRIGQLIWLHLFLGLVVLGPVILKLASTGYRFIRYYAATPAYREKGPPELGLRLLAPAVVTSTLVVFVSGIVLLFDGPSSRSTWVPIHKVSFIVWLVVTAVHVLAHLPGLPGLLRGSDASAASGLGAGATGRLIVLVGAVVGGVVLALVLMGHFGAWTAPGALHHHHHRV